MSCGYSILKAGQILFVQALGDLLVHQLDGSSFEVSHLCRFGFSYRCGGARALLIAKKWSIHRD